MRMNKMRAAAVIAAGAILAIAGCGASGEPEGGSSATDAGSSATDAGSSATDAGSSATEMLDPIKVGVIVSETGNFATQATDFLNGFKAGLDYLTDGTNVVAGHPIELMVGDDTGDPAVGSAKATEFIGEGVTILAGPTSSAVALAVADLAVQNDVLYIAGTSGTTDLVGMNRLVFATSGASPGGQIATLKMLGGDPNGKSLSFIGQDYAYGQAGLASLKALLEPAGVTVVPYLLPQETTDFLPLTVRMKANPTDYTMSYWAGAGQDQLFNALGTQGIFKETTFLGTLLLSANWAAQGSAFGDDVGSVLWGLSYYPGFVDNEKDAFLQEWSAKNNHHLEYDDVVGWNAAEFLVHGIEGGGDDTHAMAEAISDFSFEGPGGDVIVRPDDNQVTVANNTVRLVKAADGTWGVELVEHLAAKDLIPPVVKKIEE